MTRREKTPEEPDMEREGEEIAVSCHGLVKRYPDVLALAGVDLEVKKGECFGLLGPNGAGKTTCVEILEGLTSADEGTVKIFGKEWGRRNEYELRERFGVQLQETRLSEKLTVTETVRLFRSFYKTGLDVDEVIETVALSDKRKSRVGKLSGGQKQRLALACALVGDPELVFLDEPTTGLDPQARIKVWELVEDFNQRGVTVLLTTHYMEEAERLCDRVAIMDYGKVISMGAPRELIDMLGADEVISFYPPPKTDIDFLRGLQGVNSITEKNGEVRLNVGRISETLPVLVTEYADNSDVLRGLTVHKANLEDVFISLTGRALRDA
jgi:ABC-2 type transport system ATP-binding protein